MPSDPEQELIDAAEMFGAIARSLAADRDVEATLQNIVDLAVEHLDACDFAGISLVKHRRITSPVSSNDVPRILDGIQQEVDEGPCLDAIEEHEVFRTGDLEADTRWPRFAPRGHAETGVSSVLAVRLFVGHDTMGALNLYALSRDAFGETDVALGAVFAAHAGVALRSASREGDLTLMAENRDVIGQAKGILMAHSNVDEAAAFEMLRRASQRLNLKVVDIAKDVVHKTEERRPGPAGMDSGPDATS